LSDRPLACPRDRGSTPVHSRIIPIGSSESHEPIDFAVPAIADVPWPRTAIAAGEPIMTMFTKGEDVRECEDRLHELETFWHERLQA